MDDEMREVLAEFLIESYENLDRIDREFVALESHPDDRDVLASVFRTIHTIKGTAGFLAFERLERLTHVGENLLARLRDGEIRLDRRRTDALLLMVDSVRTMLADVERDGTDGTNSFDAVVETLRACTSDDEVEVDSAAATPAVVRANEATDALASVAGDADAPAEAGLDAADGATERTSSVAETSIRVDVGLLDQLVNLVGELVLARNQLINSAEAVGDPALATTAQQLDHITTSLQERVMRTRMQAIGSVWSRLPRVVRDLAAQCEKQVTLELVGRDTELDKSVLEAIKDPLTHLVRNSIDHGIETPAERVAAGKPAEGTLRLRAYHESGLVNIEISDDGRGIDPDKVTRRAVERGVVAAERVAHLSERDVIELLFAPGFSTAETVSNLSGRGVGMDVVRTNIERIGGSVEMDSVLGGGTTVHVKIPLTLAIIPALMVQAHDLRYAIPQVSLVELVRIDPRAGQRVEWVQDAAVFRLRDRLLPLVHLGHELGAAESFGSEDVLNVVVVRSDDCEFGLVVDAVEDTAEIVVKPLGPWLKDLEVFAGATIMGDGVAALILDVLGIARRVGVYAVGANRSRAADAETGAGAETRSLLVVDISGGRYAIPMDLVARLEEFAVGDLERSLGREVVQYRDGIMPILDVAAIVGIPAVERADTIATIVVERDGQRVGLLVSSVVDVADVDVAVVDALSAVTKSASFGLVGNAVIGGAVTDVLDVDAIVSTVFVKAGS